MLKKICPRGGIKKNYCFLSQPNTAGEQVTAQGTKFTTKNTTILMDENGIIHISINDNAHIEVAEAREHFEICKKISGLDKTLLLLDTGRYSTMSKEAREFANTQEVTDLIYAEAVVIHNMAQRIIMNFLKTFYNNRGSSEKMSVFTEKEKAYKWLLQRKKEKDTK